MSSTRQSYTYTVMSERLQALVAELREVERLRSRLRHVEARTLGRRRRAKAAGRSKSCLKVLSEIDPRWLIRAASMHGLSAIIASVAIWRKAAAFILRSSAPGRYCRAIFSLAIVLCSAGASL